jgi:ribosomal protein S8
MLWQMRKRNIFIPKSKTFKTIEKIQKKRERIAADKHHHINDQINYIEVQWGYTQEQKRVIERFIEQRAYSEMYNKFTASLLPQLITLIENCNNREQKGCKREVSRRIKEITLIMKKELKKKKSQGKESFETTLEVYDHLLKELK